jgi:transcription-repair coupling factor (superfamily II helicase)
MDAAAWYISAIYLEGEFLVLRYASRARIEQLARDHKGKVRIVDDKSAYLPMVPGQREPDRLLRLVKSILRPTEARR